LDDREKVFNWINRKLAEQKRFIAVAENIVNVALQEAFGPPGVSGDPLKIVYATQRLAAAYRSGIEWATEARRVYVIEQFQELIDAIRTFFDNTINEIEDYGEHCFRTIEGVIANPPKPGEKREVELTLKLTMSGTEEFRKACEKLSPGTDFSDEDEDDV
jgi:hypothetical protein